MRATTPGTNRYNPIKTAKTSFIGTMNMLGLAKRCKARFLVTSTSEVYGDPLQHPQTEAYWGNVNPIGERSCYDEGGCGTVAGVWCGRAGPTRDGARGCTHMCASLVCSSKQRGKFKRSQNASRDPHAYLTCVMPPQQHMFRR